jgi:hypothetical protein
LSGFTRCIVIGVVAMAACCALGGCDSKSPAEICSTKEILYPTVNSQVLKSVFFTDQVNGDLVKSTIKTDKNMVVATSHDGVTNSTSCEISYRIDYDKMKEWNEKYPDDLMISGVLWRKLLGGGSGELHTLSYTVRFAADKTHFVVSFP